MGGTSSKLEMLAFPMLADMLFMAMPLACFHDAIQNPSYLHFDIKVKPFPGFVWPPWSTNPGRQAPEACHGSKGHGTFALNSADIWQVNVATEQGNKPVSSKVCTAECASSDWPTASSKP